MDDSLAQDLYSMNLIRRMNSDPSVDIKKGRDSVDEDGNLAYCHFKTGKKEIAGFDKHDSWYTSVISKWKDKWTEYAKDAKDTIDNIKETWKAMLYSHEKTEEIYKGEKDHAKLIYGDMKSTPKYSDVALAQVVATDIGLEQGTRDAQELDQKTNIREMIRDYQKKLGKKYAIYKETIQDILEIPDRQYAYATVRGD